jgi:integrase
MGPESRIRKRLRPRRINVEFTCHQSAVPIFRQPAPFSARVGQYRLTHVKSPRVPAGRVRYLQPRELRLLIEASLDWLQPIVAITASTGMRRSEILGLPWMDVDMLHDRIMLPQTKNGEGRIVYLNQFAQSAFRSISFDQDTTPIDKIFPRITPERVSVAFRRICRNLGIVDFRFHDLRDTAASWLRMTGADIHTVAQLLGH